jgi:hypothetical protein
LIQFIKEQINNKMSPPKFTKERLNEQIRKDCAILLEEYDKLTQESLIKFKCKCGIENQKKFRCLTISGAYCEICTNLLHLQKLADAATQKGLTNNSNKELLNKLATDVSSIIISELTKITNDKRINFICKCGTEDSKTFARIKETGVLCKSCTMVQRRERREKTNLEKYGATCTLQSDSIKKKAEETCLARYGEVNAFKSNEIKEKIKNTNLEKYGAENPFASELIKAKLRETCKMKYGSEFPMMNPEISAKTKATNLEKYGVAVSSKADCVKEKAKETNLRIYGKEHHIVPEIMEKAKKTNLLKYGVEYTFQSPIIKDKIKHSLLSKYGVAHSSQIPGIQIKKKLTCFQKHGVYHHLQLNSILYKQFNTNLKRYGVPNANQSPLVQAKSQKNGLRYKTYITPGGEIRKVQGYEPRALDILFKTHKLAESDVITDRGAVPRISYNSNNKLHYYFPDIYIPSQNKLIEVKSSWTVKLHSATNCLKWNASVASGYVCEVWVFDKNSLNIINNTDPHKISHVI